MKYTVLATMIISLSATVAGAITPTPDSPGVLRLPPPKAAPTQLNAPTAGTITGVNIGKKAIAIGGVSYRIGEPRVAVIDRRPNTAGLLELTDLQPGMRVRYRLQPDADQVQRVVELWVLSDAPKAGNRMVGQP